MSPIAKKTIQKTTKTSTAGIKKKVVTRKKTTKTSKVSAKSVKEISKVQEIKPEKEKRRSYIATVGRRKSSVARVRYYKTGEGEIEINGKDYKQYFPYFEYQNTVLESLRETNMTGNGKFTVKVSGGGVRGQAEAIRLGISKILILIDANFKPSLKAKKLLTTDSRVKERKKYGLKKARRAPQWQKR